jgi:hypothetical protein
MSTWGLLASSGHFSIIGRRLGGRCGDRLGGGQPYPGTRGAPTGGVSGAMKGRIPARFRSFPWCFQSHASVAVTGKNTLANGFGRGEKELGVSP